MKRVTVKVAVKNPEELEQRMRDINLEFEPVRYHLDF